MIHVVILAGGGGTRLWPMSREAFPKQFLSLPGTGHGERSLIEATIGRFCVPGHIAPADIHLLGGQRFETLLQDAASRTGLPAGNVIFEPLARNTGPAIALAARLLADRGHPLDDVLVLSPADHWIQDTKSFQTQIVAAAELASTGAIVTLGIPPVRPETGFGYIQVATDYHAAPALPVVSFVEKPSRTVAEHYVASGQYLWNAGLFVATLGTLLQAFADYAPAIDALLAGGFDSALAQFADMPNISFDYAVMEHAQNVWVLPLQSPWSDVGSWDHWVDLMAAGSEASNQVQHPHPDRVAFVDTTRSTVVAQSERVVGLIGVDNLIVVDTPDALLIAQSGQTQSVRDVTARLRLEAPEALKAPAAKAFPGGHWVRLNPWAADGVLPVTQIQLSQPQRLRPVDPSATPSVLTVLQGQGELASERGRQPLVAGDGLHPLPPAGGHLNVGPEGLTLLCVGPLPHFGRLQAETPPSATAPTPIGQPA